jgi:SAM-dependent methyltransferase
MHAPLPALQRTVVDLVAEYDDKHAAMEEAIATFDAAFAELGHAATVQGTFIEPIGSKSYLYVESLRKNLLKSGWKTILQRLNIDAIISAKDKQLFERTLADPPPLTVDNAKATFGDYLIRPRFHILRGLAEVFCGLDPAYKSHSKVRIGAKGLPKRLILGGWDEYGHGYACDRFKDICNALAAFQGLPALEYAEFRALNVAHRRGEDGHLDGREERVPNKYAPGDRDKDEVFKTVDRGIWVKRFANGNAHVFFSKWALFDINRGLAEFYGEVLPDAEPENVKPSASTAVAKDLQFYRSPQAVIDAALDYAGIYTAEQRGSRHGDPVEVVLEPSCGDGAILDEVRGRGYGCAGFEYHPGRATEAKAKGHAVVTGNFLEMIPVQSFDKVVMNPPFYGRHYVKHVKHALRFLKPGGTLVAILPATAHYDHDELKGEWRDLPPGSFAESGTNVPTGLLRITAPREKI